MMDTYWHRLAAASRPQKMRGHLVDTFELSRMADAMAPKRHALIGPRQRRRRLTDHRLVLLGERYPHVYLTEREAHCALLLLRGCTSREAAVHMHLSPRTVEYYLGNIKSKLGLRRKSGVVAALLDSDFIHNLKHMLEGKSE